MFVRAERRIFSFNTIQKQKNKQKSFKVNILTKIFFHDFKFDFWISLKSS